MTSLNELTQDTLCSYDLVIIAASHKDVNYHMEIDYSPFVFDTKNATKYCKKNDNLEVL
jgi:UDP-N-acetyl-D-glucosamine dehydrogenase